MTTPRVNVGYKNFALISRRDY